MTKGRAEKGRALLSRFFGTRIPVQVTPADVDERGDLKIPVSMPSIRVTLDDVRAAFNWMPPTYVTDLMGEWLVRSNLDAFAALLKDPRVAEAAGKYTHAHFGLKFGQNAGSLVFAFHASLIRRVLDEEIARLAKKTAAAPEKDQGGDEKAFQAWIGGLPRYTTRDMMRMLEEAGYVGQEQARKAVCLMAFRHLNRIRRLHMEGIERPKLPAKDNILLAGPTGCGKTHLVELLFGGILQIPTVIVDITSYTEAGYIGDDVPTILTRLVQAAGNDWRRAAVGIVCLDEFDKIGATGGAPGRLTRDVTGIGVQRELLKMLDGAEIMVPHSVTKAYQDRTAFHTRDVPFICCGAFSGLKAMSRETAGGGRIGFGGRQAVKTAIQEGFTDEEAESASLFCSYGLMPELFGRITRVVPFQGVDRTMMKAILERNVLSQYRRELELSGVELHVEEQVIDRIVDECTAKGTGARGLRGGLLRHLEEACFSVYGQKEPKGRIDVTLEGDAIRCNLAA